MKIVVGLGNPGSQYAGTRHNVGFDVVDILASGPGGGRFQRRFDADVAEGTEGFDKILYVKPLTFMNLSGRSVRQAIDFYKVTPADLLVVCDDVNLPLGQLRLRPGGSPGGHNGLKDVERHLGTPDYPRLRLGVGAPDRQPLVDHVLTRFRPSEKDALQNMLIRAAQAVGCWIREGHEVTMNRFNAPDKEPRPKKPRKEKPKPPDKDEQARADQAFIKEPEPPRAADSSDSQ